MNYYKADNGKFYPLMRCPFCGMEVAEIITQTEMIEEIGEEPYEHAERYSVVCSFKRKGCGATCGFHDSPDQAVSRWNTRVII